jgi:hypothetical protein
MKGNFDHSLFRLMITSPNMNVGMLQLYIAIKVEVGTRKK